MKNYIKEALRTEPSEENYNLALERLHNPQIIRLLHASIGLVTEAGEIFDALKKHIFYGKELDLVNLLEEIGDENWYEAILIDGLAQLMLADPEELKNKIEEVNIAKLKARYPKKFTQSDALNRDLENERSILEND